MRSESQSGATRHVIVDIRKSSIPFFAWVPSGRRRGSSRTYIATTHLPTSTGCRLPGASVVGHRCWFTAVSGVSQDVCGPRHIQLLKLPPTGLPWPLPPERDLRTDFPYVAWSGKAKSSRDPGAQGAEARMEVAIQLFVIRLRL